VDASDLIGFKAMSAKVREKCCQIAGFSQKIEVTLNILV
jgi:hypothetical protein